MLVSFSVANFLSIRDKQTLKLTANSSKELEKNTFSTGIKGFPRLLRSVVIFGPNAGGKTNLLSAMDSLLKIISFSAERNYLKKNSLLIVPFLFDQESWNKPTEFEIEFILDQVCFRFGFNVRDDQILQEWLFANPKGREQLWFHREWNPQKNKEEFKYGRNFPGKKSLIEEYTRKNALFLSTAALLNNKKLLPIFSLFRENFGGMIFTQDRRSFDYTVKEFEFEEKKKKLIDFIRFSDQSVLGIEIEKEKSSSEEIPKEVPDKKKVGNFGELEEKEKNHVFFQHAVKGQKQSRKLPFILESHGTQKMFNIAGPWYDLMESQIAVYVDELDTSLHPLLIKFLIELINSPESNSHNSQVIFATHNTSILNKDLFRRDQVWFMDKDQNFASRLTPLSDFKPRKEEALEKGYLLGRYGALPIFDD